MLFDKSHLELKKEYKDKPELVLKITAKLTVFMLLLTGFIMLIIHIIK